MYQPPNALLAYLMQMRAQQPQNMLASADEGFDPNGIVAQMLARQRAAEAAKQMQQNPPGAGRVPPRPQTPYGVEPAESTLQRRLREQGLAQ